MITPINIPWVQKGSGFLDRVGPALEHHGLPALSGLSDEALAACEQELSDQLARFTTWTAEEIAEEAERRQNTMAAHQGQAAAIRTALAAIEDFDPGAPDPHRQRSFIDGPARHDPINVAVNSLREALSKSERALADERRGCKTDSPKRAPGDSLQLCVDALRAERKTRAAAKAVKLVDLKSQLAELGVSL